MTTKTPRKNESGDLMEKRKDDVIIAALEVFKRQGIDSAKMTDIAQQAEVGVASVYRYFRTKLDLVIAAATWLWKVEIHRLYQPFLLPDYINLSGIDQIRMYLHLSVLMYRDYPEYMMVLEYFDNFVTREKIPPEELVEYERSLTDWGQLFHNAWMKGLHDGTIRHGLDANAFYKTISHSLMSLGQKYILRGKILPGDQHVPGDKQLELLIEMGITYIQKQS